MNKISIVHICLFLIVTTFTGCKKEEFNASNPKEYIKLILRNTGYIDGEVQLTGTIISPNRVEALDYGFVVKSSANPEILSMGPSNNVVGDINYYYPYPNPIDTSSVYFYLVVKGDNGLNDTIWSGNRAINNTGTNLNGTGLIYFSENPYYFYDTTISYSFYEQLNYDPSRYEITLYGIEFNSELFFEFQNINANPRTIELVYNTLPQQYPLYTFLYSYQLANCENFKYRFYVEYYDKLNFTNNVIQGSTVTTFLANCP